MTYIPGRLITGDKSDLGRHPARCVKVKPRHTNNPEQAKRFNDITSVMYSDDRFLGQVTGNAYPFTLISFLEENDIAGETRIRRTKPLIVRPGADTEYLRQCERVNQVFTKVGTAGMWQRIHRDEYAAIHASLPQPL